MNAKGVHVDIMYLTCAESGPVTHSGEVMREMSGGRKVPIHSARLLMNGGHGREKETCRQKTWSRLMAGRSVVSVSERTPANFASSVHVVA